MTLKGAGAVMGASRQHGQAELIGKVFALTDEACLADAPLSDEQDTGGTPSSNVVKSASENVEFGLSTDDDGGPPQPYIVAHHLSLVR